MIHDQRGFLMTFRLYEKTWLPGFKRQVWDHREKQPPGCDPSGAGRRAWSAFKMEASPRRRTQLRMVMPELQALTYLAKVSDGTAAA